MFTVNTSTMATIPTHHDAHDYPISYEELAIRTINDIDSLLTAANITTSHVVSYMIVSDKPYER